MTSRRISGFVAAWLVLALGGCAGGPAQESVDEAANVLVYECGNYDFVVRQFEERAVLYLPGGTRELPRVRSGSGARFSDGATTLHLKDGQARLVSDSGRRVDCELNPRRAPWEEARLRGVGFRAVGQEPGWYLEIVPGGNILFVGDYGATRLLMPAGEPVFDSGVERWTTRQGGRRLSVEIVHTHCTDSMSGQAFDNRVEVSVDGERYHGCGTALTPIQ